MKDIFLDKILAAPGRAAADLEVLKVSRLPIVLYGDGWYAPYVREYLARAGLKAAASFADRERSAGTATV